MPSAAIYQNQEVRLDSIQAARECERIRHLCSNRMMKDVLETREAVPARHIAAVVVGNALEFYDFLTYSFFAVYIGRAFFPSSDPSASLWKVRADRSVKAPAR